MLQCREHVHTHAHTHIHIHTYIHIHAQDAAEFGRIGRYYAVESMLVWDPVKQEYLPNDTPRLAFILTILTRAVVWLSLKLWSSARSAQQERHCTKLHQVTCKRTC